MQEKNIKEVIINAEEKVKLNFTDVLLIGITFSMVFFTGMFSTVMSNWQIFLASILLCYSIIRMLNNKLAQAYYEGAIDIIEVIEEYELLKVISYKLQNKKRLVINEFTLARIIDVSPDKIYWYLKRLKRLGYIKLYKRVMFKNIITYCEILNRYDVKIFKRKD